MENIKDTVAGNSKPWWHYGHVWLIISGPVAVILACMVTFYFIINSPNQIVSGQDIQIEHITPAQVISGGQAPAMLARNHAVTGMVPAAKLKTDIEPQPAAGK